MPLKYGSELAEHRVVRERAGLFDLSHMGEIAVTGTQCAEALDFALAGQASKIPVGRAKYSLMCDADGGVIDDLVVYRLADEHFLVVANAASAPTVAGELAGRAGRFGAHVDDFDVLLARTGYTGEDGFEIYVPNAHAVDLWRSLLTATIAAGGSPSGLACRDTLRLKAGMALYGHELSQETNPYQAGLGKVVR
jgi:aminomethyltransferase